MDALFATPILKVPLFSTLTKNRAEGVIMVNDAFDQGRVSRATSGSAEPLRLRQEAACGGVLE